MTMLRRAKILVKFNVIHHEEKFPRQFKYRWMVTSKIFFWNKIREEICQCIGKQNAGFERLFVRRNSILEISS